MSAKDFNMVPIWWLENSKKWSWTFLTNKSSILGIQASRHPSIQASRHPGIQASRHPGIQASRQWFHENHPNHMCFTIENEKRDHFACTRREWPSPNTVKTDVWERTRAKTEPRTNHSPFFNNTARTPQCKHYLGNFHCPPTSHILAKPKNIYENGLGPSQNDMLKKLSKHCV